MAPQSFALHRLLSVRLSGLRVLVGPWTFTPDQSHREAKLTQDWTVFLMHSNPLLALPRHEMIQMGSENHCWKNRNLINQRTNTVCKARRKRYTYLVTVGILDHAMSRGALSFSLCSTAWMCLQVNMCTHVYYSLSIPSKYNLACWHSSVQRVIM